MLSNERRDTHAQAAPSCAALSCSESAVDKAIHVRGLRRVHAEVMGVVAIRSRLRRRLCCAELQ
jgi:hypothetical protein